MTFNSWHNFFKKRYLIELILLVVLIGLLFMITSFQSPGKAKATLVIESSEGTRAFEGQVDSAMTILEALNASLDSGADNFKYVINHNNEVTVLSLYTYIDAPGKSISFFLNDDSIPPSVIHRTTIKRGDVIRIVLP